MSSRPTFEEGRRTWKLQFYGGRLIVADYTDEPVGNADPMGNGDGIHGAVDELAFGFRVEERGWGR